MGKKSDSFRKDYPDFFERFHSVISEKPASFWKEALDVQYALIWSWKKNTMPSLEYVLRVCEIADISADWLFFGNGTIRKKTHDEDLMSGEELNKIQKAMFSRMNAMKSEIEAANKKADNAEVLKLTKWFSDLYGDNVKNIQNVSLQQLVTHIAIPIIDFISDNSKELKTQILKDTKSKKNNDVLNKISKWLTKIKKRKDK